MTLLSPDSIPPQQYNLSSGLTYYWDTNTLEWVKGTQPGGSSGGAVTIADGADVALGTTSDPAWTSGAGTAISLLKAIAGGGAPSTVTVDNGAGGSAVNIQDGGNSITVDGTFWQATQPVSAAALPLPTGAATAALQTQPGVDIGDVTVNNASGASAVNVQDGGNSLTVDAPVGTPVFVRLSDGSSAIATLPVSLASVPSHAVTNAGTFAVQLSPLTSGGLSTFMASGSDGSTILQATAQAIKASAGMLYGYYAYNPEAAVSFVHFYNVAAASVTVGTTNPLFTIQIPAGSAANLSIPQGIVFSNAGWSCAATTTAGGNTSPATGVSLQVWYA